MYIGPWQEYRLAKLQDDAIQRLRSEWEQQLRDQTPEGDDARIRELMQPMLAKLPSLLLASKSKRVMTANSGSSSSRGPCSASGSDRPESVSSRGASSLTRPPSTHSVASSVGTTSGTASRQSRNEDRSTKAASHPHSNQETHEYDSSSTLVQSPLGASTLRKTKKKGKKKPTPPLSALEEVQRRKQMFAKWIRTAAAGADVSPAPGVAPTEPTSVPNGSSSVASVSLPLIRRDTDAADGEHVVTQAAEPRENLDSSALRLPPLRQPSLTPSRAGATSPATEWDFFKPYEPAARDPEGEAVGTQPDLDDSLDEDEVNHLLDWTDTLLSSGAMDAFPFVDDDADALAVG